MTPPPGRSPPKMSPHGRSLLGRSRPGRSRPGRPPPGRPRPGRETPGWPGKKYPRRHPPGSNTRIPTVDGRNPAPLLAYHCAALALPDLILREARASDRNCFEWTKSCTTPRQANVEFGGRGRSCYFVGVACGVLEVVQDFVHRPSRIRVFVHSLGSVPSFGRASPEESSRGNPPGRSPPGRSSPGRSPP